MAFNPTPEQEKAIKTDGNILVSAAAGSGKTAVLVERVISRLTDKVSPVSADRLLIVTFTNAAAAEMRTRIEKRIEEECRKNPDDPGLLRQKHLLGSAKICTIDSFCIDIVRENFEKCGVNPDFKMSDGHSLRPTDEMVLGRIINRYLEDNDETFASLIDIVGAEYDEGNFTDFILNIYNYSRQMPFTKKWFDSLGFVYNNSCFDTESLWYKYAFERAGEIIHGMREWLAAAVDLVTGVEKAADKFLPDFLLVGEQLETLDTSYKTNDWDTLYKSLLEVSIPPMPRVTGFSGVYAITASKAIRKYITDDIEKLKKLFYADFSFIDSQFKKLDKPVKLLADILKEFEDKLFEEYNEQNTFTFHNTEHLALSLLCSENGEEFLRRYDEVMVDEYQDTNDLQDMLFYVLSGKESRLFVVGDVKQSIYGFRGANPINFLNKKNRYIPIDEAEENEPKKIILGENFRCKAGVCDFINFFFKGLMKSETGNIVYNQEEKLIPAAVFPETETVPVSFDLIDCGGNDEKKLILEARHIADYIRKTMSCGKCIKESNTSLREAKYSDFTILLRSTKNKAPLIAAELRIQGIPVNFSIEGYAESVEVETFLSLLKVVDNPKSDIELLCVMLSPIFGFTPDEMAEIRIASKQGDLFSAVVFAAENGDSHAAEFLSKIEEYRLLAVTLTLQKLVSKLLSETEYLNIVSAMRDGSRRRNNLLLLCDYATKFTASNTGGIGEFVKSILKQSENGLKSATATSGTDTVKIMSIHASKGLQFPVCIIADTATNFNDSDARSSALYSHDLGIGFRYYDEELKKKLTTIGCEVISDNLRAHALEEELRLIYVAMTRTQDKLLFTAAVSNAEKKLDTARAMLIAGDSDITANVFRRTKSYADWLLLTCLLHPDGADLRSGGMSIIARDTRSHIDISVIDGADVPNISNNDEQHLPVVNSEVCEIIKTNTEYNYPFAELLNIEAKSSVSQLANKAENDKYAFTGRPAFMSDGGITAAERGTAMHRIMQFIDFDKADEIDSEIERLYEWQFITEREAAAVNRAALGAFFSSDIFYRIKKSDMVKREMRFLTEIPAFKLKPQLDSNLGNENIIVQGAIDLCFMEDDGIVLLDFKTDRVDDISQLANVYGEQLSMYAVACEKIFGLPVKQKIIYSFSLSSSVEVI